MGRRLLSALAVAAVLVVAAAAIFDSARGGEAPATSPPAKPPPCREGQLALELVTSDEPPVVVLRHARGPRCTAPPYDIAVRVVPRAGRPGDGLALPLESGLSAPGVQAERTFRYQPRCGERGPFEAVVRVGPYSARAVVPVVPCSRTPAELAAFRRECVRSWNAAWNRTTREFASERRFDIAVVFRSSDVRTVERCGLYLVSSETAQWLLAHRVADRWWSIERYRTGHPPGFSAFHDGRSVEIGPDGALSLPAG